MKLCFENGRRVELVNEFHARHAVRAYENGKLVTGTFMLTGNFQAAAQRIRVTIERMWKTRLVEDG